MPGVERRVTGWSESSPREFLRSTLRLISFNLYLFLFFYFFLKKKTGIVCGLLNPSKRLWSSLTWARGPTPPRCTRRTGPGFTHFRQVTCAAPVAAAAACDPSIICSVGFYCGGVWSSAEQCVSGVSYLQVTPMFPQSSFPHDFVLEPVQCRAEQLRFSLLLCIFLLLLFAKRACKWVDSQGHNACSVRHDIFL